MKDLWGEIRASEAARYHQRLHAVLLSEALGAARTARLLRLSRRSVQYWRSRYRRWGTEGLKAGSRSGRPPALKGAPAAQVAAALQGRPSDVGQPGRAWTGMRLRAYIAGRFSVALSLRQCQRLLKGRGLPAASQRAALMAYGAMT